jgi:hypothetical protein
MGAAKSKAARSAGGAVQGGGGESAREVLSRRAAAVARDPVIKVQGAPNAKKPIFNDYNR